jgi:hypothetical protein
MFSGRGGGGKQFRISFSLVRGAPFIGELLPEEEATLVVEL